MFIATLSIIAKKKIGRKEGRKERRQSKYPLSRLKQYNLVNGSSEGESLKLYFEWKKQVTKEYM